MFLSSTVTILEHQLRDSFASRVNNRQNLKRKINEDINQMNLMISSILDYTQTEINAESPKNISLFH